MDFTGFSTTKGLDMIYIYMYIYISSRWWIMDGCFCKEDVPWVVAMSQQIGNFPTVFRPIQTHNCLKMWPDEWFCFNFVTSMNDLSLVILWSLSVQYIYIYTHTRVYVRAQNVNISFNVDTCSSVPFAFWKLAVSFLSAAIFCLASVCSRSAFQGFQGAIVCFMVE